MATMDKRYKAEKAYTKDRDKLAKQGWTVKSRSDFQPSRGIGRILLTGFLTKPKKEIVVVYEKPD